MTNSTVDRIKKTRGKQAPLQENTPLGLKRYSLEELKELCRGIFYDHLANGDCLYYQDQVVAKGKVTAELIYDRNQQLVSDIQTRIKQYENAVETTADEYKKSVYKKSLDVLRQELSRVIDINSNKQKQLFEEYKNVFLSHSYTIVSLNKKINALYDNFNLVVTYYDDLTNRETLDELAKITNKTDRVAFVMEHVEITHAMLSLSTSNSANIIIEGKCTADSSDYSGNNCTILPSKFADFNTVTLAECEEISNNDLRQIIQERIDMDKENLKVLADMDIKGDNYKLLSSKDTKYIRYVCPSTQRVYFNAIDVRYLAESKYYDVDDFKSYLLAWYSINNLFMELTEEELKIPANRC